MLGAGAALDGRPTDPAIDTGAVHVPVWTVSAFKPTLLDQHYPEMQGDADGERVQEQFD